MINTTALTCETSDVSYAQTGDVVVYVASTKSACGAVRGSPSADCTFTFGAAARHTPTVSAMSPQAGTYDEDAWFAGRRDQLISFTGEGLSPGNTTVTIGNGDCAVVANSWATTVTYVDDNGTAVPTAHQHFDCALPKHAAGVYEVKVLVYGEGLAVADDDADFPLSFRFGLELSGAAPTKSSVLGGAVMTFTGRGFASCTKAADGLGLYGGADFTPPTCVPEDVDGVTLRNFFAAGDDPDFDRCAVRRHVIASLVDALFDALS